MDTTQDRDEIRDFSMALQALEKRINELTQERNGGVFERLLLQERLERYAKEAGAVKPEVVAKLLKDQLAWDEGAQDFLVMLNKKLGIARPSLRGGPMTIPDAIAELKTKAPYLFDTSSAQQAGDSQLIQAIEQAEAQGDVKTSIALKRKRAGLI